MLMSSKQEEYTTTKNTELTMEDKQQHAKHAIVDLRIQRKGHTDRNYLCYLCFHASR